MLEKTWKQLADEMEMLLSQTNDEYEQIKIKLKYNPLINEAWQKERASKNTKNPADMIGTKVYAKDGSKFYKRVLKQDVNGMYVIADNMKAYVEYDAVWDNFQITHYTAK